MKTSLEKICRKSAELQAIHQVMDVSKIGLGKTANTENDVMSMLKTVCHMQIQHIVKEN